MSLFISFVPTTVSGDDLERIFSDTFGSTVMVYCSAEKTNAKGIRYKTANVEILGRTSDVDHFIAEVRRYNESSFIADGFTYTVRMDTRTESRESRQVRKFVPHIV
jgi:hypothetical protein